MTYPKNVREAAARAADWLKANPHRHITGIAVTDILGEHVNNPQAERATCFCAIGRLAKEAGLRAVSHLGEYTPINKLLGSPERTSAMFSANDRHRPAGIAMLRAVAEDREIA